MRPKRRPISRRVMMEQLEPRLLLSAEQSPVQGAPNVPAPGRPDLMAVSDSGSSSSDDITNVNGSLHFMVGSTTAGMTVSLYADGAIIGSAVATGSSTEIVSGNGITMPDGASVITARQTDHNRQSVDSAGLTVYVDTAAPGSTVPDLLTDTGASDTDNITTGINPVFSGFVGDAATAYASGVASVVLHSTDGKSATFSASGSYEQAMPTIDEGSYDVYAVVTDVAGNSYRSGSLTVSIDRTAPTGSAPDLDPSSDSGISNSDHSTNCSSPVVSGSATDASGIWKVILNSDDGQQATSASASYSVRLPALTEGHRTVTADVYDLAGNACTTAALGIDLDITPPQSGSISLSAESDTGKYNDDWNTTDDTPTFNINVPQYFRVYRDNVQISNDYETGSSFTAGVQTPGNSLYSVRSVDAAGNLSAATDTPVFIDLTPPTCTVPDVWYTTDSGYSSGDNITNAAAPNFNGSATDPLVGGFSSGIWKVELTADGTTTYTVYTSGSYVAAFSAFFDEGTHTMQAKAYDVAGNSYTNIGVLTFTIDRTPPEAGTFTLTAGSDTGMNSADGITKDNTPTFSVGASPYFRVYRNGTLLSPNYVVGNSYTPSTQLDGTYTYTMRVVDIAGNESADAGVSLSIDTVAPTGSIPDLNDVSDTGSSVTDNITRGVNPQFDGTAGDTSGTYRSGIWKVVLASNDGKTGTDMDGSYYSVILPTLDEGARTVTATVYDVAGNTFLTSARIVYVDRTAPVASVPDLADTGDSGASTTDNITNASSLTFNGTASDSGAYSSSVISVRVEADGVGLDDVASPFYSVALTSLTEGIHSVTAYATDKAGNIGPTSSPLTIYIDRTAPTISMPDLAAADDTGVSDSDNITQGFTPLFTGTAAETPSVYASGFWKNTITDRYGASYTPANIDGIYSQEFPDLSEGTHPITATAYDVAGNAVSAILTVTVDRTAPVGGNLDGHFGVGGKVIDSSMDTVFSMAVQDDGKIVVAGRDYAQLVVARYNDDGTLDDSFGVNGVARTTFTISYPQGDWGQGVASVAVQSDGKIVVGCSIASGNFDFSIVRFNADGTLDDSFGVGGVAKAPITPSTDLARSIVIQPDGKIVQAGSASGLGFAAVRYNSNGTLDDTFGTGGIATTLVGVSGSPGYGAMSMVLQPDGKIVLGGNVLTGTSNWRDFALVRYNTDGTLDPSFGTGGTLTTHFAPSAYYGAYLSLLPDGRILAAGSGSSGAIVMARYNVDGSLDQSFGTGGTVTWPYPNPGQGPTRYVYDAEIQDDGKILLAGYGYSIIPGVKDNQILLMRFNAGGSIDTSFGSNGTAVSHSGSANPEFGYAMALQADGRILVAGGSGSPNYPLDVVIARFYAGQPALDMQPASDTGASDSDNITRDTAPEFDVATAQYWRVYRDGVLVSGLYEDAGTCASDALADGTYLYTVRGVDAAGNESPDSSVLSVVIDTTAPTLLGGVVNGGAANRSAIWSLSANFSEGVTGASLGDVTVREGAGMTVDLSGAVFSLAANGEAKWDLSAVTLADGEYSAAIEASGLADIAGNALAGSGACGVDFFRLLGDCTGDGSVDVGDYTAWFNSYGATGAAAYAGDMTGDGEVDVADYTAWFNNYGNKRIAGGAAKVGGDSAASYQASVLDAAAAETEPSLAAFAVMASAKKADSAAAASAASAHRQPSTSARIVRKVTDNQPTTDDGLTDLLTELESVLRI